MISAKPVVVQLALTLISVAVVFSLLGDGAARAVGYGGGVALTNTMLLTWRMKSSAQRPRLKPQQELFKLYRSSLERFFVVVLLLAVGLGWLKLLPALLLTGFVLGQVALVITTITSRVEK